MLGASRGDHLHDNIAALEIELSVEQMDRLNKVGAPELPIHRRFSRPS